MITKPKWGKKPWPTDDTRKRRNLDVYTSPLEFNRRITEWRKRFDTYAGLTKSDKRPVLECINPTHWVAHASKGCATPIVRTYLVRGVFKQRMRDEPLKSIDERATRLAQIDATRRHFADFDDTTDPETGEVLEDIKDRAPVLEIAVKDIARYHNIGLILKEELPCRRPAECEACAASMRRQFLARIAKEFPESQRTWAVTLTMSLDNQLKLDKAAADKFLMKHLRWPDDPELDKARASLFGLMAKRWLRNNLRSALGDNAKFADTLRYLAICEPHDSENTSPEMRGRPHYHLLLHERAAETVIPDFYVQSWPRPEGQKGPQGPTSWSKAPDTGDYDLNPSFLRYTRKNKHGIPMPVFAVLDDTPIRKSWPHGFSKIELIFRKADAFYLAKYINKGSVGRIKCSKHYGKGYPTTLHAERSRLLTLLRHRIVRIGLTDAIR